MIRLRKAADRGRAQSEWLDSWYSFSFADYRNPAHKGFSVLRVLNEECFGPGTGFPTHPHREIEIVSYVLEGTLEHQDSLGNRQTLRRGDVQRMSAGRGIMHSEINGSDHVAVRLFQIWVFPEEGGGEPGYQVGHFSDDEKRGHLRLLVSPEGRGGSLRIRQNLYLYASILSSGQSVEYQMAGLRQVYLQMAQGSLRVGDYLLGAGDAVMVTAESRLKLEAESEATEFLLFDLP